MNNNNQKLEYVFLHSRYYYFKTQGIFTRSQIYYGILHQHTFMIKLEIEYDESKKIILKIWITHRHILFGLHTQNGTSHSRAIRLHMCARARAPLLLLSFSHALSVLVSTPHSLTHSFTYSFRSLVCLLNSFNKKGFWWKKADLTRTTLPYNWFTRLNFTAQQVEMVRTHTNTHTHTPINKAY